MEVFGITNIFMTKSHRECLPATKIGQSIKSCETTHFRLSFHYERISPRLSIQSLDSLVVVVVLDSLDVSL